MDGGSLTGTNGDPLDHQSVVGNIVSQSVSQSVSSTVGVRGMTQSPAFAFSSERPTN